MREAFSEDWRPTAATEHLLNIIDRLSKPFLDAGLDLSLSQVFGLLVAEERVEDTEKAYARLWPIVNKAHLSGRLDWSIGKDTTLHFFGEPGGVEVWVERDDLVLPTLAALEGFRAGVMVTRGIPSTSALYQAVQRDPDVILVVGNEKPHEERLAELAFPGDVFGVPWSAPHRLSPSVYGQALRGEVMAFEKYLLPGPLVSVDGVSPDLLVHAMDSVGDTTRAVALKRKIIDLIEEAAS